MLNILLLLQWSDNKSTLHKTTTRRKMYFVSFCSRFIDRFAPCVLFRRAMWAHQFTVTLMCTNANEAVAIGVLVVVYNKTWENWVMLSLHGQLVLDIRPRCWLRMLKLTRLRLVNFYHPHLNISAEYPALPDHDSMNNPSVPQITEKCPHICWNAWNAGGCHVTFEGHGHSPCASGLLCLQNVHQPPSTNKA